MSGYDLIGLTLDEARSMCCEQGIKIASVKRTGMPGEQWRVVRQRSTDEGIDLVVAARHSGSDN